MAPKLQWRSLATGIFFLASVIIVLSGLLIVGTNQNLFSSTYTLQAHLPDTQTLAEGTTVTLSGIEIGSIEKISLDTWQGENAVRFVLRLKKEYQPRITTSSRAVVKSIGVLGDKFLEISLGRTGEPPLADGAEIPCEGAVDYEKLIRDVSNSMLGSLRRIEQLLDGVEAGRGTIGRLMTDSTLALRLTGALEGVESTLAAIEGREGTLGRLVYDPKMYEELTAAAAGLRSVTARIDAGEGTLGRMVTDSTLYLSAAGAAAGLDTTMARINAGSGTVGKALNDSTAYLELNRTLIELQELLQAMQKDPRKYFKFSVF